MKGQSLDKYHVTYMTFLLVVRVSHDEKHGKYSPPPTNRKFAQQPAAEWLI